MTDDPTPARAKRKKPPKVAQVDLDLIPASWFRINDRRIQAVIDGDVSHIIERCPATTLAGLPTAIDDAIDITKELDLALRPVDVRLMRSLGKCGTLKVSIARPSSGVGKAR